MNERISWDHSLIKRFNSSNHFKLLTQLKNEVEKYPLNRRKNISSDQPKDNKSENRSNLVTSNTNDLFQTQNSDINKEIKNHKSTVSFNNSKNFSIYNNLTKDSENEHTKTNTSDIKQSSAQDQSLTFKDRLNQIDMK
tara:strand:- start:125 stop:538 length:414 start_codon:yes stop_codon:yes gene_type:complete